jgi:hypothetical protein
MPTGTFHYTTDAERLAIEQAMAFVAELHALAQTAPAGQVLDQCEQRGLDRGRALLRMTLQQAVQARADAADAKKGRRGRVRAGAGPAAAGGAAGT